MSMKLDERTTINLWSVVASIPIVVGFIVWLSMLWFDNKALAQKVNEIDIDQNRQEQLLVEIRERLIRIEETLKKRN